MWRKDPCILLAGMSISTVTVENSREFSQKNRTKLKIELPYNPAVPLLCIYLEKTKNINWRRYMYPQVHCSITSSSQETEATQILEWIEKMWYMHKVEYYSTIQRMTSCHLGQHEWT